MMARLPASIDEINALSQAAFIGLFGDVFEHSPWVAEAAWARRPWLSRQALQATMGSIVREASPERQLALIGAHPDLVGRAALAGTLSPASATEQTRAGLDPGRISPAEIERFTMANHAYRARFAMPFVICAREHSKATILAALEQRLEHERATEISTALAEIEKIAGYRLADLVAAESLASPPARPA